MLHMSRIRVSSALIAAASAVSVLIAGCSAPSDSSAQDVPSRSLEQVQTLVDQSYDGTDRPLPADGPAILADQNLWIVSCSQGAPGCATPTLSMKEAAEKVGWQVTVADGKLDFSTYSTLIRQAVAARANAIALVAIDCSSVQQPLAEAKAAGVKIYGLLSFDCDDPDVGGEKTFDASLGLGGADTPLSTYLELLGETAANHIIASTDGQARVVEIYEDDVLFDKYVGAGFERALAACSECTYERVTIVAADYSNGNVQSKAAAGISRQPDANAVFSPVDALVTLGVGQAALAAGPDTILASVGGLEPNVSQIAAGGPQTFAAGLPFTRLGYAAVDDLNRVLQGSPQIDQGIGTQALDADRNLPTRPAYYDGNVAADGTPMVDYRTTYATLWNVA
ncbi:hypothetical protein CH306_26620 [Rhodococcus sp. 15-725-2-2b]|nr:hypothetical protein CH264_23725 [Rhodococcus sp. 06-1477-1A]OZE67179.1 hypothetical protein CH306_26620 [Rhodococcus sp. 15-725-2-2b]